MPFLTFFFFQVNKLRRILNEFLRLFSICLADLMENTCFSWSSAREKSVSLALGFAAHQKVGKGDSVIYLSTRLAGVAQDIMSDTFFMNKIHFHALIESQKLNNSDDVRYRKAFLN